MASALLAAAVLHAIARHRAGTTGLQPGMARAETRVVSVMFRAVDVPVAAREEYWQRVIRDHMCPMDVRLDHEPGTEDELVVGDLGPVRVAVASTGPGEARRCSRHVRRTDADGFQLFVQVRGRATGEQNGRCAPTWRQAT